MKAGARIGSYDVLSPLGAGGMGEVWRAHDSRIHRDVAIKLLPEDLAASPERLQRFEQEAQAAGALNHPNVLTVFELGTHEGRSYLVTELLEGTTLREKLGRRAPRRAPRRCERRSTTEPRWRAAWPPLTRRGSSTATSSPRTCS